MEKLLHETPCLTTSSRSSVIKDAIKTWKANVEHALQQKLGKEKFYEWFKLRVAKVERSYAWTKEEGYSAKL